MATRTPHNSEPEPGPEYDVLPDTRRAPAASLRELPDIRDTPESRVPDEVINENAKPKIPGLDGIARDRVEHKDRLYMGEKTRQRYNVPDDRVLKLIRGPEWTGPQTGDDLAEFLDNYESAEILTDANGKYVRNGDCIYGTISRAEQDRLDAAANAEAAAWINEQVQNAQEDLHHTVEGEIFHEGDRQSMIRVREQNREMIGQMLMNSPTAGHKLEEAARFFSVEEIQAQRDDAAFGGRVRTPSDTDPQNAKDAVIEGIKAATAGRGRSHAIGAGFDKDGKVVR